MRVISGTARGIRLESPPDLTIRPTSDRVREATFNALGSLGAVVDAHVVDLFGGTGALGIEALSRGAARVTFVERDAAARALIQRNLATTRLSESADVVAADASEWVRRNDTSEVDLVLADPPYEFDGWESLIESLGAAVLVIESDRHIELGDRYELQRERRYGTTVVTLAVRQELEA